ncbi:MAG: hypothetical protein AAF206_31930, partial [Bacteroidota bacterium]
MKRSLKALTPAFLRRIDHQLMISHPRIWATRIHIILYWGALAMLGASGLARLYPLMLRDLPNPEIAFGFASIPAVLAVLAWAWQIKHFRPENQFASKSDPERHWVPLCYLTGILMLAAIPWTFSHTLQQRIAQLMSQDELIANINTLNYGEAFVYHYEHDADIWDE